MWMDLFDWLGIGFWLGLTIIMIVIIGFFVFLNAIGAVTVSRDYERDLGSFDRVKIRRLRWIWFSLFLASFSLALLSLFEILDDGSSAQSLLFLMLAAQIPLQRYELLWYRMRGKKPWNENHRKLGLWVRKIANLA